MESSVHRTVKVLHVLHAFTHGGLENGIVNIINGSPEEIEHQLCLLAAGGEFLQRLRKPVRCYELHKKPGNSLKVILDLARVIRGSGADIVHTRNWAAFDGVIAACLSPGVAVLHGEHGRDMSDPWGTNRRRNLARRIFSPRIRRFTTVSQDLVRWLTDVVGIPAGKIVLIPNGVDTDRFRPHRDPALRKELGIDEHQFVVGTVGRLDRVKNHAGMMRAVARMREPFGRIRLVIVGEGPERSNLEKLRRELGLGDTVMLAGFRADVHRFYGLFDVFVLNSFAEGMSNTLLEAMSSGLPVICTPVGTATEMVADGKRGRLVPLDDDSALAGAIAAYRENCFLRESHGNAARLFIVRQHSLSVMIVLYGRLYQGIPRRVSLYQP